MNSREKVIKTWKPWGGDLGKKTKGKRDQQGKETGTRYVTDSIYIGYNVTF